MPIGQAKVGLLGNDIGKLELIETQTVSGVSAINFTSIKESTYDVHFLTVNNFKPVTDNVILSYRLYESGTLENASVYMAAYREYYGVSTFTTFSSAAISRVRIIENIGNDTAESGNAYHYFYNLGDSSKYSFSSGMTMGIFTDGNKIGAFGGGVLPQTSAVDGIQIGTYEYPSNFSATASLYGIKDN
tara:strand:- start:1123 stop:1686 length:564 start_codon:yes stop_codon:yes gene_type:complete